MLGFSIQAFSSEALGGNDLSAIIGDVSPNVTSLIGLLDTYTV